MTLTPEVDSILLKNQTNPAENGVYVFHGASEALTRRSDSTSGTLLPNSAYFVSKGDVNADTAWVLVSDDPISVGTTALNFVHFGGGQLYVAGEGLDLDGNSFSVDAGLGITTAGGDTAIDTTVVVRKYATTIGNGSSTSFTVTHGLSTNDVQVVLYDTATLEDVEADVIRTGVNTISITFGVAPSNNQIRVVVQG